MTETPEVLAERHGAVLLLTLNRPDRLNAWNNALEDLYFEHLDRADNDPDVRVVVVTGAGRGFSAGADMEDLGQIIGGSFSDFEERPARTRPMELRKPLIGAINGAAAGLGFVEALYCDVRFALPTTKFTTSFAQRGLIAEYGVSWLLPRLVGTSRALDLLLSARVIQGEEALRIGLVDHLVQDPAELLPAALAYATEIAEKCAPASLAIIKGQVYGHLDAAFAGAVKQSEELMRKSFDRPDLAEGVASYLERRPPNFQPLPPKSER